jgi:hypothetical protein
VFTFTIAAPRNTETNAITTSEAAAITPKTHLTGKLETNTSEYFRRYLQV